MNIYNQFCTYLTIYKGNKLPIFYIGSSSISKINSGYHGSVKSASYRNIWEKELLESPHLFETKILTTHETRKKALEKEYAIQKKLNVVKNPLYINKAIAAGCFGELDENSKNKSKEKNKLIRSSPIWQQTTEKIRAEKQSKSIKQTINSDKWKNTSGKTRLEKVKKTFNDPDWKSTKGIQKSKKSSESIKKTKSDINWLNTVGKQSNKKISDKKNSLEWKLSTGNEAKIKQKKTLKNPIWIKEHSLTCIHCGKTQLKATFVRYHGDKCKLRNF
jgi:hypothetical protein